MSLISEESNRLLVFFSRCRDFHAATGGVGGFGADGGEWPARVVAAMSLIHAASQKADAIETSMEGNAD